MTRVRLSAWDRLASLAQCQARRPAVRRTLQPDSSMDGQTFATAKKGKSVVKKTVGIEQKVNELLSEKLTALGLDL